FSHTSVSADASCKLSSALIEVSYLQLVNWIFQDPMKSPFAPVTPPCITIAERLFNSLEKMSQESPRRIAVMEADDPSKCLTHKQLLDGAHSIAAFLKSRSFIAGDRATVLLRNCIEFPIFHLGVWAAQGALIGLSVAFKINEMAVQLNNSQSTVILTTEDMIDFVMEATALCTNIKTIICIRTTDKPLPEGVFDFYQTATFPHNAVHPNGAMEDPALIFYSSGTTGVPKGVVHTQRTCHAAVEHLLNHWIDEIYPALGVADVNWKKEFQVMFLPCSHLMGFTLLNWFLLIGSPVVLVREFNGPLISNMIAKFKPRYLMGYPTIISYFAKDPFGRSADLSSVKCVIVFESGDCKRVHAAPRKCKVHCSRLRHDRTRLLQSSSTSEGGIQFFLWNCSRNVRAEDNRYRDWRMLQTCPNASEAKYLNLFR
ncbi:hypothetical protein PFISCL1PPCAC_18891, partial [Pristionchus fissidentatus]